MVPFSRIGPFTSSLSFMGREGISLSYSKTSSGSPLLGLSSPDSLASPNTGAYSRSAEGVAHSAGWPPPPLKPPSPVPFALQTELLRVLGLLSAESLLSAHRPHLHGACASCSQGQADCPVQFPFFKILWQILLVCFLCYLCECSDFPLSTPGIHPWRKVRIWSREESHWESTYSASGMPNSIFFFF